MDSLSCVRSIGPFTCMFTSAMHTHSRCGNHSDCCECLPNYLKGLRISLRAKERERKGGGSCVSFVWLTEGVWCCRLLPDWLHHTVEQWRERETDRTRKGLTLFCFAIHRQLNLAKFWNATWLKHELIPEKTHHHHFIFSFIIWPCVYGQTFAHQSQRFLPEDRLKITQIKHHSCSVRTRKEWERVKDKKTTK